VVFAVRTRLSFFQSRPSQTMLLVSGIALLQVLAIPHTPVAGLLKFTALPSRLLLVRLGFIFGVRRHVSRE
jgi:hypothetical protein